MTKMLSVFLFFILLNVVAMPVSAQVVFDSTVSESEINIFASLVNDGTNSINPHTVEVLYDLSGNPSFLIADIVPYGFSIMFRYAAVISEQGTSED